ARFGRDLRLGTIGEGHEESTLIDAQPGSARQGIQSGDGPAWTVEELRRFAASVIEFLAVGTGHHRRFFEHPIKQGQKAHGQTLWDAPRGNGGRAWRSETVSRKGRNLECESRVAFRKSFLSVPSLHLFGYGFCQKFSPLQLKA